MHARQYLHWLKIHAHIYPITCCRPRGSDDEGRALSPEGHLLSLFTQTVSRSKGVNLIIKLHKRASFLLNHLANEEQEPSFLEAHGPGPEQSVLCFDKPVFPVGGQQLRPHRDIPVSFIVCLSTRGNIVLYNEVSILKLYPHTHIVAQTPKLCNSMWMFRPKLKDDMTFS